MEANLITESTGKIYILLFCFSLLLNIFFLCQHFFFLPPTQLGSTGSELSWTRDAAEEAEAVAAISCSGHGRAYVDGVLENGRPTCECHTCYTGADCSVLLSNCSADVDRLVIYRPPSLYFIFGYSIYGFFFIFYMFSFPLFVLDEYMVGLFIIIYITNDWIFTF